VAAQFLSASPMPLHPFSTLWLRLALAFSLFVALGALLLVLWLDGAARRESRRSFAAVAATNAELIRSARLPTTELTAEYLSRVLNLRVFFRRDPGGNVAPAPEPEFAAIASVQPERGIERIGEGVEAVAAPVDRGVTLLLARPAVPRWAIFRESETLPLLVVFGLLSAALAWALARDFVRPLRLLTARLPQIEHDPEAVLPGAERADEIGQLARAYLATRRQLAEERERRKQAEKLALLGRMATGLAHEIHNPLAAIRMHAQLLESAPAGDLPRAAAASLPVLIGETARIEGLVQQWMFLARPQPPQTAPTDLAGIVGGVVRALGPQAAHAEVRIVPEVPAGLVVMADARRLAQAVGNVAINALQAMPGGGTLCIRGESGETVRLRFHDTGPGFSPQALARHAELFFSEKEGGMGIGLSVAAEIVKAHGGRLAVANGEEGAVVTVEFPGPAR
jgi:signal transduction histidine kinase